jgi:purine nucleoside permease
VHAVRRNRTAVFTFATAEFVFVKLESNAVFTIVDVDNRGKCSLVRLAILTETTLQVDRVFVLT